MNILSKITFATAVLAAVVGLSACNSSDTASVSSTDTSTEPNPCLLEAQYITLDGLGLPGVTTFVLEIGAPIAVADVLEAECGMTRSEYLNSEDEVTEIHVEGGGLLTVWNPNEEKLEEIKITPPGEVIVVVEGAETVSMDTTIDMMTGFPQFDQYLDEQTYELIEDYLPTDLYVAFDAEGKVASIEVTTGFR